MKIVKLYPNVVFKNTFTFKMKESENKIKNQSKVSGHAV